MLTGAILAGGAKLTVENQVKALLPFGGKPLIIRQIEAMKEICQEVVIVTDQPMLFMPIVDRSTRIITDYFPSKGALSGMHAALSLAGHTDVWVVGADRPVLSIEAVRLMQDCKDEFRCDAIIPVVAGKSQPLHGLYHKRCADAAAALLTANEYRLDEWLRMLYWQELSDEILERQGIRIDFTTEIRAMGDYQKLAESVALEN